MSTPTPYELAQLAISISPSANDGEQLKSLRRALKLFRLSESVLAQESEAAEQLRNLIAGLLIMDADEWRARIDIYKGDRAEIEAALSAKQYPAAVVHRALFKNKKLTAVDLERQFLELRSFAEKHKIEWFKPHGKSPSLDVQVDQRRLDKPLLDGHVSRWAFEVRKRQIAMHMNRVPK